MSSIPPTLKRYLFVILLIFVFNQETSAGKPVHLQCEHLTSPVGVDNPAPRFTWQMEDNRNGISQRAYEIIVGTDSVAISNHSGNMWMTGAIEADVNITIYKGQPLKPFTKYYWMVTTWNTLDTTRTSSAVASFETGMMNSENWKGAWISDGLSIDAKPAPYFRKIFTIDKTVVSARAYVAVAGLYEFYINGKRIGDHVLDPMYTRFDRRTLYVTYDVTDALTSGENAIGVLLGNGWYNHQSTAVWYFHLAPWRARPTFCMDLHITFSDGSKETITSNEKWKTATGPLVFNSIYTAEHYDSRLAQPGWNKPSFNDSTWKPAVLRSAPSQNIVSQMLHPIRHIEKIVPKSVRKINDTTYVFDLGRNIAGVTEITTTGKTGTVVKLKHGERLKSDGHVDLSNIDVHYRPTDTTDPFQTDIFVLNGTTEQKFMPRFNYKGFQYVEVTSSAPINLTLSNLTGYVMHSDVPSIGRFESSNTTLNKIWEATNNSYLANLFGYPTDCPQREKNGWTGDAHIASETGLYSFDGITVYEKWLDDHRDEQQPNGVLPAIIPSNGWGYSWANGPDWTSTIAIIPWNLYLFSGDTVPLIENYDNIKRFVDHIDNEYPSGLTTWGLGDWVPVKSVSPVELTSSAYYFADATILANAARILNKLDDFNHYSKLAVKIKNAINAKYLDTEKASYGTGLQTELSVPLYWNIVPDSLKKRVASNLAKAVAANNYHLDVGILGAKAILNALSENGHAETAYKLATQTSYPSWGWWIVNGATTLYENWDIDSKSDVSLNHIMFGEIGAWPYKGLGGIKPDPDRPGFKNVLLEPHFVSGLNNAMAEHEGPYGMIRSSWKRVGKNILYTVTIPANATAELIFEGQENKKILFERKPVALAANVKSFVRTDGKRAYKLPSGTYQFEIK